MKNILYLTLFAIMGLSSCTMQKKLQANPPFNVEGPTCQKWTGGMEQTGSGFEVRIPISELKKETLTMHQIYFRGEITDLKMEQIDGNRIATAKFSNSKTPITDIIMHEDAKKEVGNQPPKLKTEAEIEFPFELNNDEAVISYIDKEGKTIKYTKVTGIKDIQPLIYSSKPRN